MRHIRIASRASKLALVQSNYIRDILQGLSGDVEIGLGAGGFGEMRQNDNPCPQFELIRVP